MQGDRFHHEVTDVEFPTTNLISEPVAQTAGWRHQPPE
jgi:hypothetical protein